MCLPTQVACALVLAGEDLEKHTDVKNVLVDMGIYFQVQVARCLLFMRAVCDRLMSGS